MLPYFHLLEARFFRERALTILGECRRWHSFAPLRELLPFLPGASREDALFTAACDGMTFDRHVFQAVVGQTLIVASQSMPRIPLDPRIVAALFAGEQVDDSRLNRPTLPLIQQVFQGSRDLLIGGRPYRPLHVGWNDLDDVERLSRFLDGVDPVSWRCEALAAFAELSSAEERHEEVAMIRDWWPELVAMYRQAHAEQLVVVCET